MHMARHLLFGFGVADVSSPEYKQVQKRAIMHGNTYITWSDRQIGVYGWKGDSWWRKKKMEMKWYQLWLSFFLGDAFFSKVHPMQSELWWRTVLLCTGAAASDHASHTILTWWNRKSPCISHRFATYCCMHARDICLLLDTTCLISTWNHDVLSLSLWWGFRLYRKEDPWTETKKKAFSQIQTKRVIDITLKLRLK